MTSRTERILRVGNTTVTLRTSDRTTLDANIDANGNIIVRGPRDTTDDIVERRRTWLYRRLAKITDSTPTNPIKKLVDGETFAVRGRPATLQLTDETDTKAVLDGAILKLPRIAATKPHKARQELINLYSSITQTWLKENLGQIGQLIAEPDLSARISTRLRTNWITRHPTRGLTIHWALGQLPSLQLRELIHRTLALHTIADPHQLDANLRNLWLGNIALPTPPHSAPCPDCAAPINTFHAEACDIARCARTGYQRGSCHSDCNTIWTGRLPGEAECEEYGFYCRPTPNGYEPCNADDPRAGHDFNRLHRDCNWDIAAQRMTLRI
ncbi:YgjP-like metallopeptidase domain-containing protein [Streptomyces sp. NPDC050516]|uniref:YgjP-like metallopeptidase domain-containing protein n=1 Tax=Streptomyces sp. NPDC050516 TaxID=3365621 RepID=UPI003797D8FD